MLVIVSQVVSQQENPVTFTLSEINSLTQETIPAVGQAKIPVY